MDERQGSGEERRFGQGQAGGNDYPDWRRSEQQGRPESQGRSFGERDREQGYRGSRGDEAYSSSRRHQGQGGPEWENQGESHGRNYGPHGGEDYGRSGESRFSQNENRDYQERGGRYPGSQPSSQRGWDDRGYREDRPQSGGSWGSSGSGGRQEDFPQTRFHGEQSDRGDWDERGQGRSFNQFNEGYSQQRGDPRMQSNRGFDYSEQNARQGNRGDARESGRYQNEDESERYYSGRGQRNAGGAGSQESATRQAGSRTTSRTRSQSQGRSQSRTQNRGQGRSQSANPRQ